MNRRRENVWVVRMALLLSGILVLQPAAIWAAQGSTNSAWSDQIASSVTNESLNALSGGLKVSGTPFNEKAVLVGAVSAILGGGLLFLVPGAMESPGMMDQILGFLFFVCGGLLLIGGMSVVSMGSTAQPIRVDEISPAVAALTGLKVGYVIKTVNKTKVDTPAQLKAILEKYKGQQVEIKAVDQFGIEQELFLQLDPAWIQGGVTRTSAVRIGGIVSPLEKIGS